MKQQQQPTLDTRISQALAADGKHSIDDLEVLIPQVEVGIEAADQIAKAAREKALDPLASPADAQEAAQRASTAELQHGRYQAALTRLRQQLAEALAADYEDRWAADVVKVEARAAAATAGLARYYELAELITAVLQEAEAVNKEVERVNHAAPDGAHRRVDKVDLRYLKDLVLPDPISPGRNLWPPRRTITLYGDDHSLDERERADMIKARQRAIADAIEAERQRPQWTKAWHEQQAKQEEERQNRAERDRFTQSQRRSG